MATLDNNKQIIASNTFQGGLVTLYPPHLLSDGATPDCQNIDFSRSYGRLTKRRGNTKTIDGTGKSGATGLYEFILAAGTIKLYEQIGSFIYELTAPSTFTVRYLNATNQTVTSITSSTGFAHSVVSTAHGYITGDTVYMWGSPTNTYSTNNNSYTITVVNANTFTLDGTVGASNGVETPAGYVAKTSTAAAAGQTNYTTFDDLCIGVGPAMSTIKSSGSFFSILLGTPPANANYIESHKDRVFIANHSGGKSRVSYCALDNPEDWTTITGAATDAGYLDVGLDDGDVITGIKSVGSVLMIFKNTSTWVLYGSDPTDFKLRQLSKNIGCVGPRTIVSCDSFCIFLSQLGVYSANADGVTMLSYNIKPTAEGWTQTQRQYAVAGRLNTQYWLAIDEAAASANNTVYYLDYVLGVWGKYTAPSPCVFISRRDGTLMSASGNISSFAGTGTGHVYTHDTGTDDAGTNITAYWFTPDYDFGDWLKVKHPLDMVISAKSISGKTITLTHYVDGVANATTLSFDLTPSGSKDKAFFLKRSFPSTSYGRYFKFKFSNAEAAAAIEIYAFSVRAAIDERQQG